MPDHPLPATGTDPVDAFAAAFMDHFHGPGAWSYDAIADCWVAPDRSYPGPGRRFCVYCRNGAAFRSTLLPGEVH